MGGTVSADPACLDAYAAGDAPRIAELEERAAALAFSTARLASVAPGTPALGPLLESVRAHAAALRRTDRWVEAVAAAFRLADLGNAPVDPALVDRMVDGARSCAAGDQGGIASALRRLIGDTADDVDPAVVATFARLLGGRELQRLAYRHPELIGPVNGFPPAVRFAANRRLIAQAVEDTVDPDRRRLLESLLSDDQAMRRPRQILYFDPSGDGRIAEVYGDLSAADDVAFFIPGVNTSMSNFDRRVGVRAADLFLRAPDAVPDRHVATVAWLGYDAPRGLPSTEMISADPARRGGRLLRDAVAGLGLAEHVSVTLIGHSYGTTVVGAALRDGVRADNVLVMGSPGMFAGKAEDFHRHRTDFFTMASPGDFVPWLERFGANPNESDSGFTRLNSGGVGHSQYLADGSLSQRNALYVIADDDRRLDRRGRNVLEAILAPVDRARAVSNAPNQWIDGVQRDVTIPFLDRPIDLGIDLLQRSTDTPRRIADGGIELVEDGAGVVSGAARWVWPG